MRRLCLNADVGETFGAHEHEFDQEILQIVQSVNVACGMYAGDAPTMHWISKLATAAGVSIGAHPGYNDLWGYGRRRIEMSSTHLEYLVACQIGALQAMTIYHGNRVTHVKAHAALYNYAAGDREAAMAIGKAIKAVDPSLIYVGLAGSEMERAGLELGLHVAREGFCDRLYEADGTLTPRTIKGAVITDAKLAVEQAVQIAAEGTVNTRGGGKIPLTVDTLCIHANEPTAVQLGRAVKCELLRCSVELSALPELVGNDDGGDVLK